MTVIPILLYHGVSDEPSAPNAPFTVSPATFAEHMDLIVSGGYRTLTVSELVTQLRTGSFSLDERPAVLVTFDDGYEDFASAAVPAMTAREIASTIYLTTGFLAGGSFERSPGPADPMLDWRQLPELLDAGVEIGAHSHTHPQMDTLRPGQAWDELLRSKSLLEDALQSEIRSFAYPHGYNSPHLRRQAHLAGYESAAAVRNLLSHTDDDLYRIARLTVTNTTTKDTIAAWLKGSGAPVATEKEQLRTWGWRNYRYVRALVTNKVGSDFS